MEAKKIDGGWMLEWGDGLWWKVRDYLPYKVQRTIERELAVLRDMARSRAAEGEDVDEALLTDKYLTEVEKYDSAELVQRSRALGITLEWSWPEPVTAEGLDVLPRDVVIEAFRWMRDTLRSGRSEAGHNDLKKG